MKFVLGRPFGGAASVGGTVCLQCGTTAASSTLKFCRRCGLPFGDAPRSDAALPSCPVCYATVGDDGRLPSLRPISARLDLPAHIAEHENHPVGDDEFLESLRRGDRIQIGSWEAPFDLVRRYLVTGATDGGRRREYLHSAIVTAMAQLKRWGPDAEVFADQPEWQAARQAVTELMERYHAGTRRPDARSA